MNFLLFVSSVVVLLHFCLAIEYTKQLRLRINDGEILGRFMASESGRTITAFMGIPYARPPVGHLRFKAPERVIPWNGTLLTQDDQSKCPQGSEGNEDCLYLNVYVPEKSTNKSLDVLVWIHGGAFTTGSGGVSSHGPGYLLEHDVILVAGNYRLGLLGFLSTEDQHATGNFGLKDQSLLLTWVQENIELFGGNKDSVTIWGESAGGVSVHYQMMSPMSRGLFHKAILHSGTMNNAWSDPARRGVARQQAFNLAKHVNCPTEKKTTAQIVECLRGKSVADIMGFKSAAPYPVVEYSKDAFIGERNLIDLLSHSIKVPVLIGMNSEEGLLVMASFVSNSASIHYLTVNWNYILADAFGYGHLSAKERNEITKKINAFYFGRETTPTDQLDRNQLINLFTDGCFIGMVETVKHLISCSNHQSTYVFLYTHKRKSSFDLAKEFFGTNHGDDLMTLFPDRFSRWSNTSITDDMELTKRMSLMWTNFVRFGNPTPDNITTPIWPLATDFPLNYMQIGNENGKFNNLIVQPRMDLYSRRANFWMKLKNEYCLSSWLEGCSSSSSSSSFTSYRHSLSFVGSLLLLIINFLPSTGTMKCAWAEKTKR